MKNGVLVCLGGGRLKNIGDYIQTIAARQFAGGDCVTIERERLNTYDGGPTRLIMNAWFMVRPERFPPTADIRPLFLSFHVRPAIEGRFFSERTVAYLKAHEPIGCRSTEVVEMMRRHGIRAEFTSCVTLTLGLLYHHEASMDTPVFVDPRFKRLPKHDRFAALQVLLRLCGRIPSLIVRFRTIRILAEKFKCFAYWPGNRFAVIRWLYAAEFLRTYSPLFSAELLTRSAYVTHKVRRVDYPTEASLLARADELLRRYARAPFVVTSRLHCALPCLAMETPCWTVMPDAKVDAGRFGGNDAFLAKIFVGPDGRLVPPEGFNGKDVVPPIRENHRPFAENLAHRCRNFMSGDAS